MSSSSLFGGTARPGRRWLAGAAVVTIAVDEKQTSIMKDNPNPICCKAGISGSRTPTNRSLSQPSAFPS
jgi:hypothetical protein